MKLRATFLKLTSVLELQLIRIIQCESEDAESVSEHYSSLIVEFVRSVLEIVPVSIFHVLDDIINLRTNVIQDLPNRIERLQLKKYAQLEDRTKLASLTKEVSILTSGVLAMKTTLMGVIVVDPKQMLEEGIRKQLVKKIIEVLYKHIFPSKNEVINTGPKFSAMIEKVGKAIEGIRSSFEYMGDYVNIDGLRIWHHEYNRIMCFLVEQESNRFLKKKILAFQSEYQSTIAPIEIPEGLDKYATILGSLCYSLLELTVHSSSIYCPLTGGWLTQKTGEEILGTKTIDKLCWAIGIEGTTSIDNLFSHILAHHLKDFFSMSESNHFEQYVSMMDTLLNTWPNYPSSTQEYSDFFTKIKNIIKPFTRIICKVGQVQLLKHAIDHHIKLKCKLEAQSLYHVLTNANDTLLQAIKQFYRDPTVNPYPSSNLIGALSIYLENCGICAPFEKIYTLSGPIPQVSFLLFGFTICNINHPKTKEDERLKLLVREEDYSHIEFVVGVITILRQMNASHFYSYLTLLGQYLNVLLLSPSTNQKKDSSSGFEISRSLRFLMIYLKDFEQLAQIPRRMVDTFISPTIFDFLSI